MPEAWSEQQVGQDCRLLPAPASAPQGSKQASAHGTKEAIIPDERTFKIV